MGYHPDVAWKMEPALEIWVDVDTTPVHIRLAGGLDRETGRNLFSVVYSLLQEGYVDFAMQVDIEPLGAAGFSTLADIQHLVTTAGGRVEWAAWAE